MVIPEYVGARIRRPVPPDACIVPGSTPVVSFGDVSKACVATLGLNPSRREFDPVTRLAKRGSSDEDVLADCNSYFSRNPYRQWFDKFSPALGAFDASYYNGSACHLDLVQWATDPTWNRLKGPIKQRLIREDAPFLENQLRANENIGLLLVNGEGAWEQLCERLSLNWQAEDCIFGFSHWPARIYSGRLFDRLDVLGWSINLQSSPGVQKVFWEVELPKRLKAIWLKTDCLPSRST